MESLEETHWDVTISGTGVAQSLLALYVYSLTSAAPYANI